MLVSKLAWGFLVPEILIDRTFMNDSLNERKAFWIHEWEGCFSV